LTGQLESKQSCCQASPSKMHEDNVCKIAQQYEFGF
jgi:hypothetical protein